MHSQKRFYEFSQTSLEGTLALAGATLEEALLVPSEGAAVEAPVPVGYLQPRLLLAQLRARGAAVSPRGVVIVEPENVRKAFVKLSTLKTQRTVCSTR